MIIIPEREIVLILVPRTGSGSLRRAVAARYPQSMLLYRHMEADGVPAGYDRWRRIGVVRHPVARLWSLYKFLRNFDGDHDQAYIDAMRQSVAMPFEEWLLTNRVPFTTPYDSAGLGRFWPQFTCRHPIAENRKSQFIYLRPDLGTEIWQFSNLETLTTTLDLDLWRHNATAPMDFPELSVDALAYCQRWFAWDYSAWEGEAL